jgi:DMSO/TMAO reductase YedYZ molybdopterin-dependent catalytic subunit
MSMTTALPPGQQEVVHFPRFGLTPFAARFPSESARIELEINGDVGSTMRLSDELSRLPRVELVSDFHCVTTWTHRAVEWSGVRFADLHREIILPQVGPAAGSSFILLKAQDGYRTSLPLEDLLKADVLLVDRMNGEPLSIAHGAPLRLVAPAHYGYKSVKHLKSIGYWKDARHYRPPLLKFMDHPRARVALEERGRGAPGWLLRQLYRPLIARTVARFQRELDRHLQQTHITEGPHS